MTTVDEFVTKFINNHCRIGADQKEQIDHLHKEYTNFMVEHYPLIKALGKKKLGKDLEARSFKKARNKHGTIFQGLCLTENYIEARPSRRVLNKALMIDDQLKELKADENHEQYVKREELAIDGVKPRIYKRKPHHELFKTYTRMSDHEYNIWLRNGLTIFHFYDNGSVDWMKTFEESSTRAKVFYSERANAIHSWFLNVRREINSFCESRCLQYYLGNQEDATYYTLIIGNLIIKERRVFSLFAKLNKRFPSIQKVPNCDCMQRARGTRFRTNGLYF